MRKTGKFTALLLSGVMAASILTGCGGIDKKETVATFDGTEIELGVANFAARLQQASYDDFYVAYFGEEVWSSDLYGNGETMQESVKDAVMQSLQGMYTLKAHMGDYGVELTAEETQAIADTVERFTADNTAEALEALGADDSEAVTEYLTLVTIESKMRAAIIADVDTNVSDTEANTGTYSYVRVSKEAYTDTEGTTRTEEDIAETARLFGDEAKTGTLEDAAEKYEYTVSAGTFTAEDENLDEAVLAVLKELKEGEVSELIDTENNYYVVRLDAKTDAEATEQTREDIITQRESDLYTEVLEGWREQHEWIVKDSVWDKVGFDNLFTTVLENIESTGTEESLTTEE